MPAATDAPRPWRLLVHEPADGAWNMAVDEALLTSVDDGPVFRIYGWNEWTLSLGRFQDVGADRPDAIGEETVKAAPFPAVRRITGGGAILHGGELTYSVVLRRDDLGTAHVKESFRRLCSFLLHFYAELGLDARFAVDAETVESTESASPLGQRTAFCYAGKELYDVLIDGRKIGGNAQRRFKSTVFQHGSIPITINWQGLERLFRPEALPPRDAIAALDSLNVQLSRGDLVDRLRDAFAHAVAGGTLIPSRLSDEEGDRARRLAAEVYASDRWTFERSRR